jgi:hypothetical protein
LGAPTGDRYTVVERNDGMFQIGLADDDALGPFESRMFASAVAAQELARSMGAPA